MPVTAAATRGARVGDEIKRGRARSPSAAHVARNASAYTYATHASHHPIANGPVQTRTDTGSGIGSHGNTMGTSSVAVTAALCCRLPVGGCRFPVVAAGLVRRAERVPPTRCHSSPASISNGRTKAISVRGEDSRPMRAGTSSDRTVTMPDASQPAIARPTAVISGTRARIGRHATIRPHAVRTRRDMERPPGAGGPPRHRHDLADGRQVRPFCPPELR